MAKKQKLIARLKYYDEYDEHCKDGYALELYEDGRWGLSSFFPFVRSTAQADMGEPEFIHFTALTKIERCLALGYEVEFLGRRIRG